MKTRLRTHQHAAEEAPQTPSTPAAASAFRPVHPLIRMQQMVGNAATQRQLQRAPADNTPPGPGKPRTLIFATMDRLDGKPIRGTSKHKGREGQMELEYFRQDSRKPPVGSERRGREGQREAPKTTRIGNANVTTTKDVVEFSFGKGLDDASPLLSEAATSSVAVRMRVDFVRVDAQGKESLMMSFELPEAILHSYQPITSGPNSMETMLVQTDGLSTTIPDTAE